MAFPTRLDPDRSLSLGSGSLAAGDFDGDGRDDLAVGNGSWVDVYVQTESGLTPNFSVYLGTPPDRMWAEELNSDGFDDLLAHSEGRAYAFLSQNARIESKELLGNPGVLDVAVVDLDEDGALEVALLYAADLDLFEVTGNAFHKVSSEGTFWFGFMAAAGGDLDGDGALELTLADPIQVLIVGALREEPVARLSVAPFVGATDWRLLFQDLTGDGRADIVVGAFSAGGSQVDVYPQGSAGFGTQAAATIHGAFASTLEAADVNADGRADLLLGGSGGQVYVFLQSALGQFADEPGFVLGGGSGTVVALAAADFNGDGRTDVAALSNVVAIYGQEPPKPGLLQPFPTLVVVQEGESLAVLSLEDYVQPDGQALTLEVTSLDDTPIVARGEKDALWVDTPAGWTGEASFRIVVRLGTALAADTVLKVVVNGPPSFIGDPPTQARAGEPFIFAPAVVDAFPPDDAVALAVEHGPEGMRADGGTVTWTPAAEGDVSVALVARDRYGGIARQEFTLHIAPAASPLVPVAIAAGASLALISALGYAVTANENVKWPFLGFFLPLYSKIRREKVLDHFVRGQIYGYIQANPGEHYNAIKDALMLTNGCLAHHLRTLEREGFVKSRKFGIYRRFYPSTMRIPEVDFQMNEIQTMIVEMAKHRPGITQKEIASVLNLTPPTIHYHVATLVRRGLLRMERRGRKTHCYAPEAP